MADLRTKTWMQFTATFPSYYGFTRPIRRRFLQRRISYYSNSSAFFNKCCSRLHAVVIYTHCLGLKTVNLMAQLQISNSNRLSLSCLSFNAQRLRSFNKPPDGIKSSNLKSFQDLIYAEDLDIIAVPETWLTTLFPTL